jgi:hypothetical protein
MEIHKNGRTCELNIFILNLIRCIIVHVRDESEINEPESKSLLLPAMEIHKKGRTCELGVFTCNLIRCIIIHVRDESSINEPESKSLLLRIPYLYSNGWKFDVVSTEFLV